MKQLMRVFGAGLVAVLMISAGPARAADAAAVIVRTSGGLVRGTGGGVQSFKGIPFAAPPLGPLRFKPPQPLTPWSDVRDATAFGPECMQPGPPRGVMSEDCLTANVWTPATAGAHLPVMVFIYGGGYAVGGSSYPVYDGAALAAHGVIVVTFNYRLNVFGFLAHPQLTAESPDHTSGNAGILDDVAALRWVQANASAFGGDPRNVTLFGESAGAGSVSAILTMPRTKGLYTRVIMESAPVFRPELTLSQAEGKGTAFAAGSDLATLRALPALELLKRLQLPDADTRADLAAVFGPIADGVVLPDERTAYANGKQNVVPIIIGNNVDEGAFFARNVPVTTLAQYAAALQKRFGANAEQARAFYPAAEDADANAAEATIVGDLDIDTGVRKLAIAMAKREPAVYRYLFTRARAGKLPGHTDELPYVFGTPTVNGVGAPAPPFDATDTLVSDAMMRAWTQFAKTGNPNVPGTAMWPAYTTTADRFVVFGDTMTTATQFRTAQLDFLNLTVGR